ncbi:hypothetical protein D9758_014252 [Tetrapyrgos nigripes]|uniref:Glycoside hydrolase family 71 protein n=1 Tax=Tetrapyrgos nigripes TaxID=182062 RepID=A0A8H5CAC4_9AGAR|nr:hypothetical protein D9758_014252 [Tetrapyrgos nigripes]
MFTFLQFSLLALGLSVAVEGNHLLSLKSPFQHSRANLKTRHGDSLFSRDVPLPDIDISLARLGSEMLTSTATSEEEEGMSPVHYLAVHPRVDHAQSLAERKYVFMHVRMQSVGIDAVAMNIGGDQWQTDQLYSAYAQAHKTSIKLFISFDYTAFPCDTAETIRVASLFMDHPAQFKVAGRPMISSYSGVCLGVDGWKAVRSSTGGFLMPFIYGEDYQDLREGRVFGFFDSWYWVLMIPDRPSMIDIVRKSAIFSVTCGANDAILLTDMDILGKRYATTVSGGIYTHYDYKNFYLRGEDWLLASRWEQLFDMRDQLTFVEMVTWNDYGESDYFGPLTSGVQPTGTTWATGFPHEAWLDMSKYYIHAFKTGHWPAVVVNEVFFWCRPHPARVNAMNDPLGKPSGWDWGRDAVWIVVFCASSHCEVDILMGSRQQTFTGLSRGVSKVKMDLGADDAGPITVKMFTFIATPAGPGRRVQVAEHSTQGAFEFEQSTQLWRGSGCDQAG